MRWSSVDPRVGALRQSRALLTWGEEGLRRSGSRALGGGRSPLQRKSRAPANPDAEDIRFCGIQSPKSLRQGQHTDTTDFLRKEYIVMNSAIDRPDSSTELSGLLSFSGRLQR